MPYHPPSWLHNTESSIRFYLGEKCWRADIKCRVAGNRKREEIKAIKCADRDSHTNFWQNIIQWSNQCLVSNRAGCYDNNVGWTGDMRQYLCDTKVQVKVSCSYHFVFCLMHPLLQIVFCIEIHGAWLEEESMGSLQILPLFSSQPKMEHPCAIHHMLLNYECLKTWTCCSNIFAGDKRRKSCAQKARASHATIRMQHGFFGN